MLLGAEIRSDEVPAGDEAWVTLYWQPTEPIADNVQVRVRLVDASGLPVWQGTPAYPVSNRYPPVAWKDREVVPDFYAIPVGYTLLPGTTAFRSVSARHSLLRLFALRIVRNGQTLLLLRCALLSGRFRCLESGGPSRSAKAG
jgi:hypothetical protein